MPKQNIGASSEQLPRLGNVTFSAAQNAQPNDGRKGVRSILVARATLPITTAAGMVSLLCALWGRLTPIPDGMQYDVSASLPGGRFPVIECDSETEQTLLGHVERSAQRWAGFNAAYDTGEAKLTGKTTKRGIQRQPDKLPALVLPGGIRRAPLATTAATPAEQPVTASS